jgi:hypothetical protein
LTDLRESPKGDFVSKTKVKQALLKMRFEEIFFLNQQQVTMDNIEASWTLPKKEGS